MICIYCNTHKVHSFFSAKYCSKLCFELHQHQLQKHAEELAGQEEALMLWAKLMNENPEETKIRLTKLRDFHQGPFKAPWLKSKSPSSNE